MTEFLYKIGELLLSIAIETAGIFYESSIYVLIGLAFAGILHEFIPLNFVAKHLGSSSIGSIVRAALFGAPLPLCSCSVLPAAATLRKKGASKPATAAFVVSVPETGVDSIAVTYGLLGPFMAIFRPMVALVSAVVAGLACVFMERRAGEQDNDEPLDESLFEHEHLDSHRHDHGNHDHAHAHDSATESSDDEQEQTLRKIWKARSKRMLHYGFGPMLHDIAFWVVAGLLVTGVMLAVLPEDFFSTTVQWDSGIVPMLVMVVIGVPLYTCASMSTPIAAGLIASGLAPGAALVYLLVGPATSIATLGVTSRLLGRSLMLAYLASIISVALLAGWVVDTYAADIVRSSTQAALNKPDGLLEVIIKVSATIVFVVLAIRSLFLGSFRQPVQDIRQQWAALRGLASRFRKPLFAAVAGVVIIACIPAFFLQVPAGHSGFILRLGKVTDADLSPGLYPRWPWPIGNSAVVDTQAIHQITIGSHSKSRQSHYLTADENIVSLSSSVTYRVANAYQFAFGIEHNEELLIAIARNVLIAQALKQPIDEIFTTSRRSVEASYRRSLQARINESQLGYEILDARLLYAHAPEQVHNAFRDVASALEDRQKDMLNADGNATARVNAAAGKQATISSEASADAAQTTHQAEGKAASFSPLAKLDQQYPALTRTRLRFEAQQQYLAHPQLFLNATGANRQVDIWVDSKTDKAIKLRQAD